MGTAPVTGKSLQPSHEPPRGKGGKQVPVTLIKREEKGEGAQLLIGAQKHQKKRILTSPNATTHLGPRANGIVAHARMEMPQTTEGLLVFLVVNSVKLYLTAKNFFSRTLLGLGHVAERLAAASS